MKGLVLVKQVPDTNSVFRVNSKGTWIDESNLSYTLNDYDRYGLEEALKLKDNGNLTEVIVLTVGPANTSPILRNCLAMGADRAIHIKDDVLDGCDPLSLAKVIKAALKDENLSIVLAGLQAEGDNHMQIGGLVAGLLDWPFASAAMSISLQDNDFIRVERELDNNQLQVVDLQLPAVVTVQTGINTPRYASLKGIMAAKKKPLSIQSLSDLGLDPDVVGSQAARLTSLSLAPPTKGNAAEILAGSPDKVAQDLLERIRKQTGLM